MSTRGKSNSKLLNSNVETATDIIVPIEAAPNTA